MNRICRRTIFAYKIYPKKYFIFCSFCRDIQDNYYNPNYDVPKTQEPSTQTYPYYEPQNVQNNQNVLEKPNEIIPTDRGVKTRLFTKGIN